MNWILYFDMRYFLTQLSPTTAQIFLDYFSHRVEAKVFYLISKIHLQISDSGFTMEKLILKSRQ